MLKINYSDLIGRLRWENIKESAPINAELATIVEALIDAIAELTNEIEKLQQRCDNYDAR